MKARILMFGWEFPPHNSGGLGVACQGLTRALSARDFEIAFVMPKKLDVGAPWARFIFADVGVGPSSTTIMVNSRLTAYATHRSYKTITAEGDPVPDFYGEDLMSEVMRYSVLAGAIAKRESFDVIYAHDWLSFGAGMEAKRVTGKPLVVHVHATEFDRCGGPNVNPEVYAIERKGMEAADRVIAVSQFTKDIIVKHYGIPPEKVSVVHNGIDEATVPKGAASRLRMTSLKAAGYGIVLFLGRITLQKGPDYFLHAAQKALAHDPNIIFVFAGSGDMEQSMMELAASLGIADKVVFTGFLTGAERHEVYAAADLFVMPSVSEPFGITALEAMVLGTPVLVSKQSGASEAIAHALKADFWDIDEMANKMLSAVHHSALRQTLTENGKFEAERLTWDEAAGKVENVLNTVPFSRV